MRRLSGGTAAAERLQDACGYCGIPRPPGTDPEQRCPSCRRRRFAFQQVIALGGYRGAVRRAVIRMKQFHEFPLTAAIGALLADELGLQLRHNRPQIVVPVPKYWLRRWLHGSSAAELLAEVVGRRLRLTVAGRALGWRRRTRKQSLLPLGAASTEPARRPAIASRARPAQRARVGVGRHDDDRRHGGRSGARAAAGRSPSSDHRRHRPGRGGPTAAQTAVNGHAVKHFCSQIQAQSASEWVCGDAERTHSLACASCLYDQDLCHEKCSTAWGERGLNRRDSTPTISRCNRTRAESMRVREGERARPEPGRGSERDDPDLAACGGVSRTRRARAIRAWLRHGAGRRALDGVGRSIPANRDRHAAAQRAGANGLQQLAAPWAASLARRNADGIDSRPGLAAGNSRPEIHHRRGAGTDAADRGCDSGRCAAAATRVAG